jgi:hypothetical protein
MSSTAPKIIHDSIEEVYTKRQAILEGEAGDYKFVAEDIMNEPDKANTEAQSILNKVLNKKGAHVDESINTYRTANGICGLARDHLAASTDRLHSIVAYATEVRTTIEHKKIAQAIPGYLSKD